MGYFSNDHEDERFFTGVHRALKPKGMFVVDYLNRDRIIRYFRPNDQRELPDGTVVHTNREYDSLTGRMHEKRITLKNNQEVRRVESSVRFYGAHELINLAVKVGFKLWATYGDFDESALTMDSKRVILIFQKGHPLNLL
jgi:SAM-dependent methyltransferase